MRRARQPLARRPLAISRSLVVTLTLRVRLTLALTASLLAGGAATVAGAGHLVTAQQLDPSATSPDFRRTVWATLSAVAAIATSAGLLTVLLTTRALGAGVQQVRTSLLSLSEEVESASPPPLPPLPLTQAELLPLHDAVHEARAQLQDMLRRVRQESDRNRAIVDTVFASVFAVDAGGRIIHANAAAARMFDRPMHALTGVVLSDMIATESLHMSVDELGTITFHGARRFTTSFRVFGRHAFPADVSVTPLPLEGQRAWAVFVHDLSEKHRAEVQLEAARHAAVEANRAKTAFLARMGGELRAPLDATIGFTQVVLKSRSSQLSERDRHYLERVQSASTHLLTMVGDILDLSQIEAGTIVLEPAQTDVGAVVMEIVAQFDEKVAGRPVMLESDLPDMPVHAEVDALRLRQVLTHLVSNAIKFTARGTVRVTVCRQGDSGQATAVIVRDTGIGIPLERQARVFDLFVPADHDISQRYGGTGLGLALSKRLATAMGCRLSVESMPGAGSIFTLSFAPSVPLPASRATALVEQRR